MSEAIKITPETQQERLARARAQSVMLLTPMARDPKRQFTVSMIDTVLLLERLQIPFELHWVAGNSNLPRARNELAAAFLASKHNQSIWIDDDMGWKAGDVVRLLASDKDFIGGVGRKKVPSPDNSAETWCCRFAKDEPIEQDDIGALRVNGIGTGFVKMSRKVYETVAEAMPDLKRPGPPSMPEKVREQMHAFFQFVDAPTQLMSEDYLFCELWKQQGGKIWADPKIELIHVGDHEFKGTIESMLVVEGEGERDDFYCAA